MHVSTFHLGALMLGNRANSLELEGREARQLECLSRQGGIEKKIAKGTEVLSLCR